MNISRHTQRAISCSKDNQIFHIGLINDSSTFNSTNANNKNICSVKISWDFKACFSQVSLLDRKVNEGKLSYRSLLYEYKQNAKLVIVPASCLILKLFTIKALM